VINDLRPGEVFVFGSNASGAHGAGAARTAYEKFGAEWGEGHGLHGQSYAIDTMSGMAVLEDEVRDFLEFSRRHPDLTFLVTKVGCGIAGYTPEEVAPLFTGRPVNVVLPDAFRVVLDGR
jgi:hypothetical protein